MITFILLLLLTGFGLVGGFVSRGKFLRPSLSTSSCESDSGCSRCLLKWNMTELLGAPQSPQKLLHLVDVYNAAVENILLATPPHENSRPCVNPMMDELMTPPLQTFVRSYESDLGHDGRFLIPNSRCSLQSSALFSMPRPLSMIRSSLSCTTECNMGIVWNQDERAETVVMVTRDTSLRIHPQQQLEYFSAVLDGLPLAQLHVGSFAREDDESGVVVVDLTNDIVQALLSLNLLLGAEESNYKNKLSFELDLRDLDLIRSVVSWGASLTTQLRLSDDGLTDRLLQSVMKLIDVAVSSSRDEPHLVLIVTNDTCIVVAAAVESWKQSQQRAGVKNIEGLLHKALTIVSMGSLCRVWPDGPACIHVSMLDDPFVDNALGGYRAVHLQALSPWTSEITELHEADTQNLMLGSLPFLSLLFRINGNDSFRSLYRDASASTSAKDVSPGLFAVEYCKIGNLEIPPRMDIELLPSMIQAVGGLAWRRCQTNDVAHDLPDLCMAEAHLTDQLGYGAFRDISKASKLAHRETNVKDVS